MLAPEPVEEVPMLLTQRARADFIMLIDALWYILSYLIGCNVMCGTRGNMTSVRTELPHINYSQQEVR